MQQGEGYSEDMNGMEHGREAGAQKGGTCWGRKAGGNMGEGT